VVLSLLAPASCGACGTPGPSPCAPCAADLRPPPALAVPAGLAWCAALFAYEGPGRALVTGLKLANERSSLGPLAAAMAALVDPASSGVDAVTWAPTTTGRRRRRGFDQAELLARAVATELGLPVRRLLDRRGPAVTGSGREERAERAAFEASARSSGGVLVVDDVRTTGATLSAAARALTAAGAASVAGLTLAATPEA
jgi:predicted amidophosphoribosyltransferase